MKKIENQPPVTPERSETPISQIRYVLLYERHSSYLRTAEKNQKQTILMPVRAEIPVSQNDLKNKKSKSPSPPCPPCPALSHEFV